MQSSAYLIDFAHEDDIPSIMELERRGFDPSIVEDEAVFRLRLATFPGGFVVLRPTGPRGVPILAGPVAREAGPALAGPAAHVSGGAMPALGYLCAERWAKDPGPDPEAFLLGHDPGPRYSPSGRVLYIASMTLDPSLRGSGLGERLFREGLSLIHRGSPGLELELLIVNEAWGGARRIYEESGFRLQARFPSFFPAPAVPGAQAGAAGSQGERLKGADALLMERRAI